MMKRAEAETKSDEALKSQIAIQCAKAALMLSSLKSSENDRLSIGIENQHQEKEILKKEVADLKVQLTRERLMNKRIKLCGLSELLLHLMVLLSLSTVFLLLAFRSISN